jgi:hypothetical protein
MTITREEIAEPWIGITFDIVEDEQTKDTGHAEKA